MITGWEARSAEWKMNLDVMQSYVLLELGMNSGKKPKKLDAIPALKMLFFMDKLSVVAMKEIGRRRFLTNSFQ